MTDWAPKRFWQTASAEPCDGGFTVRLDGRTVKTPAKTLLVVPTLGLAQEIAAEWQAQQGKIDPRTMPFTRTANSALDKVAVQFGEVAGLLAAYGASDLLCYRAERPEALVARQAQAWDPLLEWAATTLDAPLWVTSGIVHILQPAASTAALSARVFNLTPYHLAAFHDLVAISGSLVLAFAVTEGRLTPDQAWDLSRIDEQWQAELWGEDDDARESEDIRRAGFAHAGRFFELCG